MNVKKCMFFAFAALAASALSAEIKLPRVFSDDMMFQRQKPVKVWGLSDPGADVRVEFGGKSASAKAGGDGKWSLFLGAMEASSEPRDMKVYENGKLSKTVKGALVGEVWILGGQSNMEMEYSWRNLKPDGNPLIRYFSNPHPNLSETPLFDTSEASGWRRAEGDNPRKFSMVGYGFARRLARDLGVPVGLVYTARGGSWMETWIPFGDMDGSEYLKSRREEYSKEMPAWKSGGYEKAAKAHKEKMARHKAAVEKAKKEKRRPPSMPWSETVAPVPETPFFALGTPAIHWNGKVAPLAGYSARGFLWYQGESNAGDSEALFAEQFGVLLDSWRRAWGDSSMPWISVELASYAHGKDWGRVRAAQRAAAASSPNSYICSAADTGEKSDIHPADKDPISERLERIAMRRVYGAGGVMDKSPEFSGAEFKKGGALVKFDSFGGKLEGRGEPRGFELKIGGKWVEGGPELKDGSSVWVASPDGAAEPEGVRYLWKSWAKPDAWLYTSDGLPAFGFCKE